MQIAIAVAAVVFVFLSGRNDGGPLLALPLQFQSKYVWAPVIFLYLCLPVVTALGLSQVALNLESLLTSASERTYAMLILLVSVLVTLAISTFLNAPTSITLALLGSLAGVALGTGGEVPWADLGKVLLLGLLAPIVSALLAYLLRSITLRLAFRRWKPRRRIGLRFGYFLLLGAYATNDGQKVIFATSVALGLTVSQVMANPWWILGASLIFTIGALAGAVASGRFIRLGISRPTAGALAITEYTASFAVIGGSLMGAPLSMTQSIAGGLTGTGLALSSRSVYWGGLRTIALTWLWTLPVAALISYLLTLGAAAITT